MTTLLPQGVFARRQTVRWRCVEISSHPPGARPRMRQGSEGPPAPPCCGRPWARAGVPYPREKAPRRQARLRGAPMRQGVVFAPKPRHRCCVSPGPLDQPEAIRPWPPSPWCLEKLTKLWTALACLALFACTAVTTPLKLSRGERFGHLTAVEQARFDNHHQLWWFKCSCGTVTVCKVHEVKSGHTRSCGCLRLNGTKFQTGSV